MHAQDVISAAEEAVGGSQEYDRLDQVSDLQHLLGPVIAYKTLLEITLNSADAKERRLAATALLNAASESPERVAERLRASIFKDLSLADLEAIVNSGITDPARAAARLKETRGEPTHG